MPKRDYKSYNVLGDELQQDGIYEDNKCTAAQEVEVGLFSEAQNKEEDIPKVSMSETSEDVVEIGKLEKKQKDTESEEVLHSENKINLYKKLVKSKKKDKKIGENKDIDKSNTLYNSIDKKLSKSEAIDKDIDKNSDKRIVTSNREDKSINRSKIQEEVDMTFSGYKDYYQTKERSKLVKWGLRLAKFILTIMLLPLIAIIAGVIVLFLGSFLTAIIIAVGTGIFILGTICFMSTQMNASLVALGISVSVTAISFGGILSILFHMLIKWNISLLKKYRRPSKQSIKKEAR